MAGVNEHFDAAVYVSLAGAVGGGTIRAVGVGIAVVEEGRLGS